MRIRLVVLTPIEQDRRFAITVVHPSTAVLVTLSADDGLGALHVSLGGSHIGALYLQPG
jgi:hypothetical protein